MRLLLVLHFLPIILGQDIFFPPGCGRKNFTETLEADFKVLGGQEMTKPFPWIARVDIGYPPCTGSLISRRHVLTAGHCLTHSPRDEPGPCTRRFPDRPGEFSVCIGTMSAEEPCDPSAEYNVTKIHLVDEFVDQNCPEMLDIALLELDRDVVDAVPVCLPTIPLLYSLNRAESRLFVAGYGNNNDFEELSEKRINTRLRFAFAGPRIPCPYREDYGKICTAWDDEISAICNGDSGGPLTELKDFRHVIIGVNQLSLGGYCRFNGINLTGGSPYQAHIDVVKHLEKIMAIVQPLY